MKKKQKKKKQKKKRKEIEFKFWRVYLLFMLCISVYKDGVP